MAAAPAKAPLTTAEVRSQAMYMDIGFRDAIYTLEDVVVVGRIYEDMKRLFHRASSHPDPAVKKWVTKDIVPYAYLAVGERFKVVRSLDDVSVLRGLKARIEEWEEKMGERAWHKGRKSLGSENERRYVLEKRWYREEEMLRHKIILGLMPIAPRVREKDMLLEGPHAPILPPGPPPAPPPAPSPTPIAAPESPLASGRIARLAQTLRREAAALSAPPARPKRSDPLATGGRAPTPQSVPPSSIGRSLRSRSAAREKRSPIVHGEGDDEDAPGPASDPVPSELPVVSETSSDQDAEGEVDQGENGYGGAGGSSGPGGGHGDGPDGGDDGDDEGDSDDDSRADGGDDFGEDELNDDDEEEDDGDRTIYTHVVPPTPCRYCANAGVECVVPLTFGVPIKLRGRSCVRCRAKKNRCCLVRRQFSLTSELRCARVVRDHLLRPKDRAFLGLKDDASDKSLSDGELRAPPNLGYGSDIEERVQSVPLDVRRYIRRQGLNDGLSFELVKKENEELKRQVDQTALTKIAGLRTDIDKAFQHIQQRLDMIENKSQWTFTVVEEILWQLRNPGNHNYPASDRPPFQPLPLRTFDEQYQDPVFLNYDDPYVQSLNKKTETDDSGVQLDVAFTPPPVEAILNSEPDSSTVASSGPESSPSEPIFPVTSVSEGENPGTLTVHSPAALAMTFASDADSIPGPPTADIPEPDTASIQALTTGLDAPAPAAPLNGDPIVVEPAPVSTPPSCAVAGPPMGPLNRGEGAVPGDGSIAAQPLTSRNTSSGMASLQSCAGPSPDLVGYTSDSDVSDSESSLENVTGLSQAPTASIVDVSAIPDPDVPPALMLTLATPQSIQEQDHLPQMLLDVPKAARKRSRSPSVAPLAYDLRPTRARSKSYQPESDGSGKNDSVSKRPRLD